MGAGATVGSSGQKLYACSQRPKRGKEAPQAGSGMPTGRPMQGGGEDGGKSNSPACEQKKRRAAWGGSNTPADGLH